MAKLISTVNRGAKNHRKNICWMSIILFLGMMLFLSTADPSSALAAKRVGIVYAETSDNQVYEDNSLWN